MNKNRKTINYKLFSLFLIIIILIAGAIYILNNKKNFLPTFAQHPNDLYAPTMIEKIKDDYLLLIVDITELFIIII